MIEIYSEKCIEKFKERNKYPEVFADYLLSRFNELKQCLQEFFEEEGEFNLKNFGHMVVLEKSDNLRDLKEVGLNSQDNGIFGSVPEVVEEIIMPSFSVYQISNVYTNDYMMLLYLPKGDFEELYPEMKSYLKRWTPEKIHFRPKGKWNHFRKKDCLFNATRLKTQGVDLNVSEQIQIAIWNYISTRKNNQEIPMDYLQIFTLRPKKLDEVNMQVIECTQEIPPFKQTIEFPCRFPITDEIFVLASEEHQTMMLAREY